MRIIKSIHLGNKHKSTGATRHYSGTVEITQQIVLLQIVQCPNDNGYYLLYLDNEGAELTDTYHESLEAALDQAPFEFCVQPEGWIEEL